MNRRRLLASLGALMGGGILLEYLGLLTYLLNPCDAMHRIELRTVAVDSSESPPDPLRFADLSDGEQDVVLTAIREGKYMTVPARRHRASSGSKSGCRTAPRTTATCGYT